MFKKVEPILHARDVDESVAFYRDRLGFDVRFVMAGPEGTSIHASVTAGNVTLMLGRGGVATPGGWGALYIYTDDVDGYFERVRGAGVSVLEEPTDQFWGDRTFSLEDPDGHVLSFAQEVRPFDPSQPVPATATA